MRKALCDYIQALWGTFLARFSSTAPLTGHLFSFHDNSHRQRRRRGWPAAVGGHRAADQSSWVQYTDPECLHACDYSRALDVPTLTVVEAYARLERHLQSHDCVSPFVLARGLAEVEGVAEGAEPAGALDGRCGGVGEVVGDVDLVGEGFDMDEGEAAV